MSLLIFLMNKKRPHFFCIKTSSFIHFFSSFPVCLLATCSLLSAIMYVRRTYVLPTCLHFFLQTCVGIMEIATGDEQCNANLTKGQEISEAIFFCLQFSQEPRAGILEKYFVSFW